MWNKILIITSLLALLQNFAFSQRFTPDVIGSAGDFLQNPAMSFSLTIGEGFTETFSSPLSVFTQGFQQPGPDIPLMGNVFYANASSTPLGQVQVRVLTGQAVVNQCYTDPSGNYSFSYLPYGPHTVQGASGMPWGGGNSQDALLAVRQYIGLIHLGGISLLAADVDGNHMVNAADALAIQKRFVHLSYAYPAGDWVFENPAFSCLPGSALVLPIQGSCFGDIDGSFDPNAKVLPKVIIENEGFVNSNDGEMIEIPVLATGDLSTAAISLVLDYQAGSLEIRDVVPSAFLKINPSSAAKSGFVFNAEKGELRISWYNSEPVTLKKGDELFSIALVPGNAAARVFEARSESVIADQSGLDLPLVKLAVPQISGGNSGVFLGDNYPNPFNASTTIAYEIPEDGRVRLNVFNLVGEKIASVADEDQAAGEHRLRFDAKDLMSGTYFYKLEFRGNTVTGSLTRRMTVIH